MVDLADSGVRAPTESLLTMPFASTKENQTMRRQSTMSLEIIMKGLKQSIDAMNERVNRPANAVFERMDVSQTPE